MNILRKGIALFTMMALVASLAMIPSLAEGNTPGISIDGKSVSVSEGLGTPYIDDGNRLQVPIRFVSEKLGASVVWDNPTQTATINGIIKVKVGDAVIQTAMGSVSMDTIAVVKANRIYVPIRYIGNALGYKVVPTTKDGKTSADIITKEELTISAAASLKDAMNEVKELYLKEKPNTKLTLNFGSSGSLAQQIEQGAEVDLFFSASAANVTTLKDKGLLDNSTIKNLLGNKMVLIAPLDTKLAIGSFAEVLDASVKKIALGEPKSVPAGQYAEDVFTKLNILTQVKAKAVYGKDVREVLTWVETGNADTGVVYSTDAKISTKVKVLATAPADTHKAIVYPAAVVKATDSPEATVDFLCFLRSDSANAVFEKYGFSILK